MSSVLFILGAIAVLGLLYFIIRKLSGAYFKFRGKRVVTCPETKETAAVEVDAGHAALTGFSGKPDLRLQDCTRWPERQHCGQECLRQIEAAPEDCLVRMILTKWYEGKTCIYCGKPLGEIDWIQHKPCLMSPAKKTVEWKDVAPEKVPLVLQTYVPVCWNCHIAETFRREHPDLVTERDWKK